jgi:endonuclease/exonuclease/phosphatase family metal-dependent hydrolase
MKRILIALGLMAASPLSAQIAPDVIRVATHNVHYIVLRRETGSWSVADWEARKPALDAAFKAMDADIIGFQEMESFGGGRFSNVNLARDWLLENNPGYAVAASGPPAEFPSTQPILFRADRFEMLDQGWWFFSETPDVIYSPTFNGSFPAYATWAEFREIGTTTPFKVVNLHTDFSSSSNRLRSRELTANRVAPWIEAGERVIMIGDFNARAGAPTLACAEEIGVRFLPVDGSTYHFNMGLNLFGAIDHIGLGPGIVGSDTVRVTGRFAGD